MLSGSEAYGFELGATCFRAWDDMFSVPGGMPPDSGRACFRAPYLNFVIPGADPGSILELPQKEKKARIRGLLHV